MKIKICGLSRLEDIEAANEAQPDIIGFVFAEKSRRYVPPEQAELLKRRLSSRILAAGVFVDATLENIRDLVEKQVIDIVQLHGNEDISFMEKVKNDCQVPVIKAISMTGAQAKEEVYIWEQSCVDYLLLDSGAGGTGKQFDYRTIGRIGKPFFLAGGLNPDNVAKAALQVRPFGVDISSGVETQGKKEKEKMEEAVRRIRNVERKIR